MGDRTRPEIFDSPGKKYPRLVLLFLAIVLFAIISWLPHLNDKNRGPLAFVWPENQTRSTRHLVRPDQVTTLLKPSNLCKPGNSTSGSEPYLLVVVCSAVENWEARVAVRESWARDQSNLPGVRVLFLVGRLVNNSRQEQLLEEQENFGDLVQENFLDSYANLTIKSVMMLKWFTQFCERGPKGAQYVLKTDDDMYINLVKLWELVQANKKPKLLMGSLICNAVPIKDPYNKWYVPKYMFAERRYPNYLSGTAYLMSRQALAALYQASLDSPLFHLEDIYITGLLARKAGIRAQDHIGFSYTRRKLNSCLFRQTVSTHHVKHNEMRAIYDKLVSSQATKCLPIRSVVIITIDMIITMRVPIRSKQLRDYGPGKCKWPSSSGLAGKNKPKVRLAVPPPPHP